MKAIVPFFAWVLTAVAAGAAFAQPPEGSQLPPDEVNCITCHGEEALWEGETLRLYIPKEPLEHDVHFRAGVNCHDCHGGNPASFEVPEAHSTEVEEGSDIVPFRSPLAEVKKACAGCHQEEATGLHDSSHVTPPEGSADKERPTTCADCHGEVKHSLAPLDDPASPLYGTKQIELCGGCHSHEEARTTYLQSVHGHGLEKSGLLVTARCADCHGAHAIFPVDDPKSTLSTANVADTCATCHRFIEERLAKSVHGGDHGPGRQGEETAPGGTTRRTATCTDCHQGHALSNPESARFRQTLPKGCGTCHAELSHQYGLSVHGELTELGYGPAAKCSDCHGAHDILPIDNPKSLLSAGNRLKTCGKCHPGAVANFVLFDPHADYRNPSRDPIVHGVWLVLMTLLFSTFGFFGLHSLLWLVRSAVDVARNGRPPGLRARQPAYVRFGPFHRTAHTLMLISFLGLALTGLPLKYSQYEWAKSVAFYLGGFGSTGVWHRIFGVMTFLFLIAYSLRLVYYYRSGRRRGHGRFHLIFGPDSPLPGWRDVKDFFRMIRWFVGLGPKPTFERWAYWEKFDFWGASADIIIIGTTGLILWFPNLVCAFLPGITLNVAKVIHSTQALLATGFVFAIHFFNTHLRAEKFPADMSVLTGLVSAEEMEHERPELLERMREEGLLEEHLTEAPSRRMLWAIRLGGFVALAIGLALLVAMIVAGVRLWQA